MRFLIILSLLISCSSRSKSVNKKSPIKVEKSTSSTMYTSKIRDCFYRVNILTHREKTHLELKSPSGTSCAKDFNVTKKEYYNLLDKALSDYPTESITYVMLPSLMFIQPDFSWNLDILKMANKSKVWKKFILNYPKNPLGLSSNKIFVDTVNKKIPQGLEELFKPYNIKLKLRSVEKVFASRTSRIKELNDKSKFTKKYSLFYDAGVYVFKNGNKKK